jgi:hypothetical protein
VSPEIRQSGRVPFTAFSGIGCIVPFLKRSRSEREAARMKSVPNRLTQALNAIEHEQEAPIYALERLRGAVAEDQSINAQEARRLRALDKSGAGRAFGSGWMDFLAYALSVKKAV